MWTQSRNWKWMVPAGGFGVFLLLLRACLASGNVVLMWFGFLFGILTAICGIAAVSNFYDYRRVQAVEILERKKRALTMSALANELASARGVHPEAVKALINERHRVWMLKSGVQSQGVAPHSVLFGAPAVTDYFLEYFLKSSSDAVVMPKRLLVDGRKNRFDPHGAVTEYAMYDQLTALLEAQGKIVKYSEYEAYQWMPPWTPQLVAVDFGLVWEEETVGSK